MRHSVPLGTLKNQTLGTIIRGVTLPARAYGLVKGTAKGTASSGARLLGYATGPATSPWQTADTIPPRVDTSRPVNVNQELGLDPAPADRGRPRRTPPVTEIDAQAEPRLVDSTPADVAARIARPS